MEWYQWFAIILLVIFGVAIGINQAIALVLIKLSRYIQGLFIRGL